MRIFVALATFFIGACCTPLPRMPAKRVAFPSIAPSRESVSEASEIWRDEKRNRDVPVKIYGDRGPVVIVSHGIGGDRDSYASSKTSGSPWNANRNSPARWTTPSR